MNFMCHVKMQNLIIHAEPIFTDHFQVSAAI